MLKSKAVVIVTVFDCPTGIDDPAGNVDETSANPVRVKVTVSPLRSWGLFPKLSKVTVKFTDEVGQIVLDPTKFTPFIRISLS